MLNKVSLFFKAIIVSKFIAVEGLQERNQTQKMVKNCAGLTGGCLKLAHAFYIGMLTLRYRTGRGEKVIMAKPIYLATGARSNWLGLPHNLGCASTE